MSSRLHEYCNDPSIPICLIRGLVEAIGLGILYMQVLYICECE